MVAARDDVRRHIGLVFQDPTLDGYLTAEQNLRLHAELYGVESALVPARMEQVLRDDPWSALTRAMKSLTPGLP